MIQAWRRREFLGVAAACGLSAVARGDDVPASVEEPHSPHELDVFDQRINALMRQFDIPGGSVAISVANRLVYARGFGFADAARTTAVTPRHLFRIASVSKPITAVAVLRLADEGRLRLDDLAFACLRRFNLDEVPELDPRIRTITIRQLLSHAGGWDRESSFDPMFRAVEAAEEMQEPAPASPDTVIRYMLRRPLDFDPGARTTYSNFGYCLLGRVIEQVTCQPYERAVRELVLRPAGIERMRLGKSRRADCGPDEVFYDDETPGETTASVFPGDKEPVSWCYGGFHLEAMDSHGGWLASPADLLRFATAVDGRRDRPLLMPATLGEMTTRPAHDHGMPDSAYMALGWNVVNTGSGQNWWHTGSLPGASSLLVRAGNGRCWAAVFNDRPADAKARNEFHRALDQLFWEAAEAVAAWPDQDLFPAFP